MGIRNFLGDLKVLYKAATLNPPTIDTVGCIPLLVQNNAQKYANDIALICEGEDVTWVELNGRANRVAHTLAGMGIEKGDCVSLFMQNRVEFVVSMLGVQKLGATVGMINTNITKQQLTHCINLIDSKKCIFGEELVEPLEQVRADLNLADGKDYLFVRDPQLKNGPPPNWCVTLDSADTATEHTDLAVTKTITMGDRALYIFTSGTTGLPKAAIVSNRRILPNSMMAATALFRIDNTDRMYNCLPLYHATGLLVGLTAAFSVGASSVIRRRLSISGFWDDIRKNNCTCFIYIGEFIRYLMSRPPHKDDAINPIRAIAGNGLRPDIWMAFKERFDVERIGELYGASEGNGSFANVFNKDCTVGMGSVPAKLAQYDVAADEIVRDTYGKCVEVNDIESPGLLMMEITDNTKFEGYTSDDASEKKIVRDAFETGDIYFNTGDLMKTVDVGFAWGQNHYQFVDRVGDTFRWKSENVSTNEIAELINEFDEIIFTNVYGVEIPGADGRAGMAAIVLREGLKLKDLDLEALSEHIANNLASYSRPIFIRILKDLPTTSTHKLQKNELRDNAYHLDKVTDDLLVMKPGSKCYCRLDSDFYDQIVSRNVAF